MTALDVVSEILFGLRRLGLDYRANETSPDGPWRAQCPLCYSLSREDDLPLTITAHGWIRCRHRCDPEQIAAALDGSVLSLASLDAPQTTWAPVDLERMLAGDFAEALPSMLRRTDGRCLLYPARTHSAQAEPEALKTWLALKACVECLELGKRVLYVDFEDSAPSVVQRLIALGVGDEQITSRFVYVRPDEPLAQAALTDLEAALRAEPMLAVIDGVTEAFSRQGLSPLDNSDVATWLDLLPRRLMRAGAAVLMLDHVVKDREQRGRYALGAQHKLAGVDVAYSLRVIEPFARGRDGEVAIKVEKDRPGLVREFAQDGHVATLRASSQDGRVSIKLEVPERAAGSFRPTVLMERISLAIEADPGLSKRAIRTGVKGQRHDTKDLALELLIAEGYAETRTEGRAVRHYSLRPYREADDTGSGTCPNVPGHATSNRATRTHPLRGARAGHVADTEQEAAA